jgi:Glycosyl hydrolase family 26
MSTIPRTLLSAHPRPARADGRRRRLRAASYGLPAALALALGVGLAAPAQAAGSTVLLGSAGDAASLSRQTGENLPVHTYRTFSERVPTGVAMLTVASGTSWRNTANAGPGSTLYNQIVNWAQTIKSRPGTMLLAYHHEPEAHASAGLGTPADYIAAYRHVISIFRAQGVTNVKFVWQMTAYAFKARPSDRRYAPNWYPGDAYVDVVGADGYNWRNCDGHNGAWTPMSGFTDPVLAFAKAHGKTASLPEFGAPQDTRRTQWLQDARSYMAAHKDVLSSAFYFNRGPANPPNGCSWVLNKQSEFDAFRSAAQDPNFRTA